MFDSLKYKNGSYQFTNIKSFKSLYNFKTLSIKQAFDFAYDMSFGGKGAHRDHRSGGDHKRKNGEIFINTFQGKLSEFGIYNVFYKNNIQIPKPDLETYELGKWDKYDFKVNNKKIAVKSTKPFGQLLLLECKDWNADGEYLPNKDTEYSIYDYFILVRIKANSFNNEYSRIQDGEALMKKYKLLYLNTINKTDLEKNFSNFIWSYDIPGYITRSELIYIIKNNIVIHKGDTLGKYTHMDADNYYVQTGNMHDISEIFKLL